MEEKKFEHAGLKAGISGAIAMGWLVFVILFLAFFSEGYRTNEKFAVLILSILVMALLLGGMWLFWSVRMMTEKDWELFRIKGFKWRIIGTLVFFFALLIVLIYGFWYIWTDFGFWQYIAIFLVIIILAGGLMAAIWAPWSAKYKGQMDKYGTDFGKKIEKGFEESFGKKDDEKKE